MNAFPRRPWWPAAALGALGLGVLYAGALSTGFLNDDYLFLEEARTRGLGEALTRLGALGNYYRPLSRQLYFALLTPIMGGDPRVFHAVNGALFLGALALLADLLLVFVPPAGALAGLVYFALLPLQRVNLTWVSCSQDLLALVGALGAFALWRRGRTALALTAYLAAVASKESALPLPLALAAWSVWIERRPRAATARRAAPFAVAGAAWAALAMSVRAHDDAVRGGLAWTPATFAAGWVHEAQALVGLEHPPGMARALFTHGPALMPLVLLGALALWMRRRADPATVPRGAVAFAVAWLVGFGVVTGPVAGTWSAYYYTLCAVGAALLVALALRRIDRWGWVGLVTALLWWHAGSSGTRAFAIVDGPWGWSSHLTSFYFERGAALTRTLSSQLRALEPEPPHDSRFFFAALPPWAGFQMGNGALVRALYRDPSLQSYFFTQWSESTAAGHPNRFFYWDGAALRALYRGGDPFFQVGTDLLLMERDAAAAHAFRRALAAGGNPADNLYWLGWAELWSGHRDAAEDAWTRFGARDDAPGHAAHWSAAQTALARGAPLVARRELLESIRARIGDPAPHAELGDLLVRGPRPDPARLKYGLLELRAAVTLEPGLVPARRRLVEGLVGVRLEVPARHQLEALLALHPELGSDSTVAAARRALAPADTRARVVEFP